MPHFLQLTPTFWLNLALVTSCACDKRGVWHVTLVGHKQGLPLEKAGAILEHWLQAQPPAPAGTGFDRATLEAFVSRIKPPTHG